MKRTKLFQYKLGEFSKLSGIDTYRLKKLDESGILKANIYNGRRYYDDVALALSPLYKDEVFEPSIHDIKMEVEKLIVMIERTEKDFTKKRNNDKLPFNEKELSDALSKNDYTNVNDTLKQFNRYLEQIQSILNHYDGINEIIDLQNKNGK